ncbi:MAG: ATP-binding protein [Lachnospiraceae bacterium]|nr:ATP-binding protein [Lachnospiraceae bacterium]
MNQIVYTRNYYLDKIRGFYKSDLIKVITGIRRCGKSCFLLSVINDLLNNGISEKDIICINLDKRGYKNIKTPEQLEQLLDEKITDNSFKYIFIDEIQNVSGFEEVINAFREEGNCSLFITGSNSYLLSGELATKLIGRYIEIEMFPLNFFEYMEMKQFLGKPLLSVTEEFSEYLRFGGFPKTLEFDNEEDKNTYVTSVIHQILDKDIKKHRKIRNKAVFEKVMTYIINNLGATTNLSNLTDYFNKEENLSIRSETINSYIEILENAKIIYKCPRFDVKSRKSLRGEQKYYLADLSIYFSRNVDARINYGPVLENIMYTYLRAKNYHISVGRIGKLECDFITRKDSEYQYLQVAMTIMDEKTEEREYKPFESIRDNYPKYLFTMDPLLQKRNGIHHCNLINFIANNKDLE